MRELIVTEQFNYSYCITTLSNCLQKIRGIAREFSTYRTNAAITGAENWVLLLLFWSFFCAFNKKITNKER